MQTIVACCCGALGGAVRRPIEEFSPSCVLVPPTMMSMASGAVSVAGSLQGPVAAAGAGAVIGCGGVVAFALYAGPPDCPKATREEGVGAGAAASVAGGFCGVMDYEASKLIASHIAASDIFANASAPVSSCVAGGAVGASTILWVLLLASCVQGANEGSDVGKRAGIVFNEELKKNGTPPNCRTTFCLLGPEACLAGLLRLKVHEYREMPPVTSCCGEDRRQDAPQQQEMTLN